MNSVPRTSFLLVSLFFLLGSLAPSAVQSQVVNETIIFLDEDGRHYVHYEATRTDKRYYNLFLGGFLDEGESPEDEMDEFMYLFPNDYSLRSSNGEPVARFPGGNYAFMRQGELELDREEDGTLVYRNWSGETPPAEGHYGVWYEPGGLSQVVRSWVFPRSLEIVDYRANREGEWVVRGNTLTFYAQDVNDLVFEVRYRFASQQVYDEVREGVGGEEFVEVEEGPEGVRVVFENEILFPSGSATLTDQGREVLETVAERVRERDAYRIVVEGHTDDVPVEGEVAEAYATNWELSAARALAVLHQLSELGISGERLEARAMGSQRPRATNDTPEGRAQNRRVELLIERVRDDRPR